MRLTKMHGAGNDYLYLDCLAQPAPEDPAALARRVSDRHFGVGADGLILICPSARADVRMRIFNADGSEAEMCGNGIRCLGKYVYDHGLCRKDRLRVETEAGRRELELEVADGRVGRVRVDMGAPILKPEAVPTTLPADPTRGAVADAALNLGDRELNVTCLSMGNPHCVAFVDELSADWVRTVGPRIETDAHFPQRVNAEFVEVISPEEVRVGVWERGSGVTLACGTGACAVCVAGTLTGRTQRRILAHLPGGDLQLDWAENGNVYLTGPAVEVFNVEWDHLD